jgi:DNA recombination protein RmuC
MPDPIASLLPGAFDPLTAAGFAAGAAAGALLVSLVWLWRLRARTRAIAAATQALERAETRTAGLEMQLAEMHETLQQRGEELASRRETAAELRVRLEETQRSFAEKEALLQRNGEALRQEFEALANRIFQRHGEEHQVQLEARLGSVLGPFKDQLSDFRKRVDTVYASDTRERASLLAEVKNLQQASERINREAENLTKALKGDVKIQGNWGEMVLERVLQASGLRQGEEYFLQASRRDDEGSLKRPDVLIRLPDDKDVVVDAKLSLLAYEQALATDDPVHRDSALGQHVASLRAHVRRLADQDYDQLRDVRSLDFVLLFVPIEAAFTLAMEHDQRLFTEAFERRIVIVSPTTLMMTLRIIHNVWRYEKQSRNAQEIARRAGALYDKLRGFVDDMETLGRHLETADHTYKQAFAKLSTGRGNLLRRAETFRELGAPVKRPLPAHLVDDADSADET